MGTNITRQHFKAIADAIRLWYQDIKDVPDREQIREQLIVRLSVALRDFNPAFDDLRFMAYISK